jgi:hypothetical protein
MSDFQKELFSSSVVKELVGGCVLLRLCFNHKQQDVSYDGSVGSQW